MEGGWFHLYIDRVNTTLNMREDGGRMEGGWFHINIDSVNILLNRRENGGGLIST